MGCTASALRRAVSVAAVLEVATVFDLALGLPCGSLRRELAQLPPVGLARLLEAAVQGEQEPRRLHRTCRAVGLNATLAAQDLDLLADVAAHALPWRGFTTSAVLITGALRGEGLLLAQLRLFLEAAHLVVLATWKGGVSPESAWLRWAKGAPRKERFLLLEVEPGLSEEAFDVYPALTSAKAQDKLLRLGLDAVARRAEVASGPLNPAEVLVLKTRTDVYLPPWLVEHIFHLDYSLAAEDAAKPFLYRVWVPWFDALQPFYLADETFAASLLDARQLCWPPAATRPLHHTMGRPGVHVNRWLSPFLPWYPLLFAYRRNAFDLTDKLLEWSPSSGRGRGSLVVEMARRGLLHVEADAYLLQLLGLWYRLVLSFFLVGGPPSASAGAHLILAANGTAMERGGRLEITGVRCTPGSFGFVAGDTEVVVDSSLAACRALPADTSAAIVRASGAANHFARPVFAASWPGRVLAGHVVDGLSERVVAAAVAGFMPALHVATPAGRAAALRHGRYDEELQVWWCEDFFWSKHSLTWQRACSPMAPKDEVSESFAKICCFPRAPVCPRWLASGTLYFTMNVLNLLGVDMMEMWLEMERTFHNQSSVALFFAFCHGRGRERKRRFQRLCRPGSTGAGGPVAAICYLARAVERLLPALAPAPTSAGAPERLWRPARDALEI